MATTTKLNEKKKIKKYSAITEKIKEVTIEGATMQLMSTPLACFLPTEKNHIVTNKINSIDGVAGLSTTHMFKYLAGLLSPSNVTYRINATTLVTITDHEFLNQYYKNDHLLVLKEKICEKSDQIFETREIIFKHPLTILDVSKIGKIIVERPGTIDIAEIEKLLPLPLVKDFIDSEFVLKNYIDLNSVKNYLKSSVIMGPREIINVAIPESNKGYYKYIESNNQIYYNLGSVKSPQTLLKKLYKTIIDIKSIGLNKITLFWVDTHYEYINNSAYFALKELYKLYQDRLEIKIIHSLKHKPYLPGVV